MSGAAFDFHGIRMQVHLTTAETGAYGVIEMHHPPNVGPALHVHPRGPESFLVLEGDYVFPKGSDEIKVGPAGAITIPAGTPHRYVVGPAGGRAMVIMPGDLERYFVDVGAMLADRPDLPFDEESAIAAAYGQDFLESAGHWVD